MEYMKTLPDNAFDLAICDPPYGGGNDGEINGGGRFGGRFDRYKSTTLSEVGSRGTITPPNPSENSFYRFFNFQFISVSTYKSGLDTIRGGFFARVRD